MAMLKRETNAERRKIIVIVIIDGYIFFVKRIDEDGLSEIPRKLYIIFWKCTFKEYEFIVCHPNHLFEYIISQISMIFNEIAQARWNPRFARMKSASQMKLNPSLSPDEVGFHHEVISSHESGIYSVRKDGFSWKRLWLYHNQSLFLVRATGLEPARLPIGT